MKTIIEAGHFYSVNGPSIASVKGWHIGKELAANTPGAELALFVDDYHTEQAFLELGDTFLEPEESSDVLEAMKGEADHVFSEAALAARAQTKMLELLSGNAIKQKRTKISTLTGGIVLGSLTDKHNLQSFKPYCVFLDWMLLAEKAQLGGEQVIVLPDIYQKEQAQLALVANQLVVSGLTGLKSMFFSMQSGETALTEEVYA